MLIIATSIIQDHRFGMIEQEHAAEHVLSAEIPKQIGTRLCIPHRDSEMVVSEAVVFGDIGPCAGEDKNPRFAIIANLIFRERRSALGAVDNDTGKNSLGDPTSGDRADGVQDIDGRMRIAPDVSKGDSADEPLRQMLKIERSAPTAEDLDDISTRAD